MSQRPMPQSDFITKDYWEGTKREQLLIQRCESCKHWNHPPKERCPNCGSGQLKFEPVPLKGEVYSYCITHQSRISGFEDKVPYVVVTVKIDDLPVKIVCNIVDCHPDDVHIGMPVDIIFEHLDGFSLPQATPRKKT